MATGAQILLVLGVSFALGILAGYLYGRRTEPRKFYKYPSAHWRIRRK